MTVSIETNVAYAALAAACLIVLIVYIASAARARWEEKQRPPRRYVQFDRDKTQEIPLPPGVE